MTDYFTPMVVQQPIPVLDMTPLERLVLSRVFHAETGIDGIYFHSETGPCDMIEMPVQLLRNAYERSIGSGSLLVAHVGEKLATVSADDTEIDLDLSEMSWEVILQDIVRRSQKLDHITVVAAFTCSKMRSDGFGGMAILITADAVRRKSTHDIIENFLIAKDNGRRR